ncbi:beta-N-acetylglucosaminidase domain-containing protein [Streptantibioticus silvisoli]|uniref:Beta-N-acetylglucosaminidase domain-containing protein n=1 Tax=Streptantibioticus silvisoli TaxID=2705255 RepID=A0ABT6W945_9ACTN|nr:beta-N-acetylglucosaminidase domain-containing protein [Streptantibioticus silvisoli]MDI5967274.1 beta-N-acetylglucosaminidase domain-containing protein [Streptantibioticus silvisoli]
MALAAAVIGGVLGGTPIAVAAPAAAAAPHAAPEADSSTAGLPGVWPRPQSMAAHGRFTRFGGTVTLVAPAGTDPYALDVVRAALRSAGAREVRDATAAPHGSGAVVYAGGAAAGGALRALGSAEGGGLPSGGYRLAVGTAAGRATVAMDGVGPDGLFHAAQTLRQLAQTRDGERGFAGVLVRDWPATGTRGITEGFYGQSWTTDQRLAQLDFMGRTKQDFYLYAPGDDPYRQDSWREPYPAAQRADWRTLAKGALRNHVTLGWAVSPGQSMCYSSTSDVRALLRKADAMWALGVRAFQLQFADVSYSEWHCSADAAAFGSGPAAAARAQASVANALELHLAARYNGAAAPLSVLPTEYYQDGTSAYRSALSSALSGNVDVAWTGVGVVPATITGHQLAAAKAAFGHPVLTMDNYPVNDYAQDRVFLGPYEGRDPSVATGSAGVLANAMRQPSAARIPLFTAADYAWNPHGYSATASWRAAVDDLAGHDPATRAALAAFAGNDASSPLDPSGESAYLRPLIDAFWAAYDSDPGVPGASGGLPVAAARLRSAFETMAGAPGRLAGLAGGAFGTEVRPWLDQLGRYGRAGAAAVDMLTAQRRGDGAAGWSAQSAVRRAAQDIGQSTATVGGGVLGPFLTRALDAADAWTGVRTDRPLATASLGSAGATDPSLMTDGQDATYWLSDRPPQPGDWFGVDLGSVRAVSRVSVAMGDDDDSPAYGDYLGDAVLEYSADGGTWHAAGTYSDQQTISARLPAGATARYVRLRATAAQQNAVAVRDFTVGGPGAFQPVVTGPAGVGGTAPGTVADGDPTTPYRPAGTGAGALTMAFGRPRPLAALTVLADPGGTAAAGAVSVEAHVPGQGWRRVGRLDGGFTELALHGATADGVRLSWAAGAAPPALYGVVPWFADAAPARLSLRQPSVDAQSGGAAATVRVALSSAAPSDTHGTLTASAPHGIEVAASGPLVLRRGTDREVALRVTVAAGTPSGTYRVPVVFTCGGRSVRQTLVLRAYPRTAGPDLALGAAATSSGEETPAFPASAATDGRADTRWSSPAVDGAWLRVDLGRPVRLGAVVLGWQQAYAAAFRVEVSADGRHWRTAASVTDGHGGTETVGLDAPDTRYVRIQGVSRATRYGYSLWSLRAYAVAGSQ